MTIICKRKYLVIVLTALSMLFSYFYFMVILISLVNLEKSNLDNIF